jgi:hypothetical protein
MENLITERTKAEIDDQAQKAMDSIDDREAGRERPEMGTYEDGVVAAIDWILGNKSDPPMPE